LIDTTSGFHTIASDVVAAGGLVVAGGLGNGLRLEGGLVVPGGLAVNGGTLTLAGETSVIGDLKVNGGQLDMTKTSMVVDYGGESPISLLISYLADSLILADGNDGTGLPTYLAIAEAEDLGLTEFDGIALDGGAVLMKFTYVGDANLDGQVDALDYERVDLGIGNTGVFGVAQGDLNYDGAVDALDYEQIDLNIGNGVGTPLAAVFVPEPGVVGVAALAGIFALRRRR
jgi:MYXO-CTERM domain-containing protein